MATLTKKLKFLFIKLATLFGDGAAKDIFRSAPLRCGARPQGGTGRARIAIFSTITGKGKERFDVSVLHRLFQKQF